jgi:hypothetical protein
MLQEMVPKVSQALPVGKVPPSARETSEDGRRLRITTLTKAAHPHQEQAVSELDRLLTSPS